MAENRNRQGGRQGEMRNTRRAATPTSRNRKIMEQRRRAKLRARRRRRMAFAVVFLLCFSGIIYTIYGLFNSALINNSGVLPKDIQTPKEIQSDNINFLICGIDYEDGRSYGTNMGMTDVILYVSFDIKANRINILQIPRDTFIGSDVPTGGTGKINAIAYHGTENPPIASLARVISEEFGLPIDYYVTIDMDAFREIINKLDGIEVYVPERMELDGNVLEPGLTVMDGATAEFFVRYRNFAQADIKRLEMQRYFYAAVFNKLMSFPPSDVVKVLPVYMQYVETDLSLAGLGRLFPRIMQVPRENIYIYRVPGEAVMHNGHSVYSVHRAPLLECINTAFRPYQPPLAEEDFNAVELAYTNDYITGEGVPLSGIQTE